MWFQCHSLVPAKVKLRTIKKYVSYNRKTNRKCIAQIKSGIDWNASEMPGQKYKVK